MAQCSQPAKGTSARKIDIVARYGGEEFALVLEGTDRTGARQLAERIRQEGGAQTHDSGQGRVSGDAVARRGGLSRGRQEQAGADRQRRPGPVCGQARRAQ
ncbi:MAG TPA: diguanylate cyclase, partial [Polyangia bacterium]|nr:diguanylate cyclase [Polyangia bacterium]